MCANYASMPIKPGSMGRPIPGVELGIVDENFDPVPAGEDGNLVVRPVWPSMFHQYWQNLEMYNSRFKKGWYITGDTARMDEDGYFWFVGRADDVINTAGHLVGPFEVESALIEHEAVAEAGVIGKPDPIAMESRQGIRVPQGRLRGDSSAKARDYAVRQDKALRSSSSPRDRLHSRPSQDSLREDNAPPAESPRTGPS